MGEVTNQIAIVLGVLVACLVGPTAALLVLMRRKAEARQNRRYPIRHCAAAWVRLSAPTVRRTVCRRSTKTYNRIFPGLLKRFSEAEAPSTALVTEHVKGLSGGETQDWPDDAMFQKAWLELNTYKALRTAKTRMLLEALELGSRNDVHQESAGAERALSAAAVQPDWSGAGRGLHPRSGARLVCARQAGLPAPARVDCGTRAMGHPAPDSRVSTRVPASDLDPGNPASMRLPARSP